MLPSCLLLECPDPARIHDAKENHGSSRLRQDRRCQRLNRRLLSQFGTPNTPPRVPRSTIMPFRQTKGSRVGILVVGFGVVFVYENPATSPLSSTKTAQLSLPPSVPRSRITPFCQRNACTSVAKKGVNGWKQNPNESGILFSAPPTTCPPRLMLVATALFPPKVPRSVTLPACQSTARCSGKPVKGSMTPFSEFPTV